MPLFATTKTAEELKAIGPFAAPERSRARRCMVTHTKGDQDDVFVRLQAHGNIYDLRPGVAVEVPEVTKRRFMQAMGDSGNLGVREIRPGDPDYAQIRFGDHSPVAQQAPATAPAAKMHLPSVEVLNRFPKDDLVELAKCVGATATLEHTKKDIIAAIDACR